MSSWSRPVSEQRPPQRPLPTALAGAEAEKPSTPLPMYEEEAAGPAGAAGGRRAPGIRSLLPGILPVIKVKVTGESGRSGVHPWHFCRIAFMSSNSVSRAVNLLWPVAPAAVACRYSLDPTPTNHLIIFILSYIGMVPCANMIGYAGQELSRKVPHVFGVLIETA